MIQTQIIFSSARSVTIELLNMGIYETAIAYEIFIDGILRKETNKIVTSIYGLNPATTYEIAIKYKGEISSFFVTTKKEFVTLNVKDFGAKGDGKKDDTGAIQAAILSCPPKSRVYIPQGIYKITSLFLKSNLILEIGENAVLSAFTERSKFAILPGVIQSYDEEGEYNLGSWEGNPLDTFASIITGIHVENVVICGQGMIDGCTDFDNWWKHTATKEGGAFRPRMIFLNHCENIILQGITVQNSPSWNIHPYFTNYFKAINIKVLGPADSCNTDGLDPESCNDVEIVGCYFSVGDDCIALKSGKIYMGKKLKTPSQKIRIRQTCMRDGHGAITLGSEIAAGVNDLKVENCLFLNTDRGLRIKTRRGRGKDSILDKIEFKNIIMDHVKAPFVANSFYFCDPDGRGSYVGTLEALPVDDRTPILGSFKFTNISCTNCHFTGAYIHGLPEQKIKSIIMENVNISYCEEAQSGEAAMMLACEPTCKQGIFIHNAEQVILRDVSVTGNEGEPLLLDCIDKLSIEYSM
jgi:Endopolygalacturonase